MTFLRALVETVGIVVDAVIAAMIAAAVAYMVLGANVTERTVDAPTTVAPPVWGEPMPDVQPLLDNPLSPDGGPVPFNQGGTP